MSDNENVGSEGVEEAPSTMLNLNLPGSGTMDKPQGMVHETNQTLEEARQAWSAGTLSHRRLLS